MAGGSGRWRAVAGRPAADCCPMCVYGVMMIRGNGDEGDQEGIKALMRSDGHEGELLRLPRTSILCELTVMT